MDDEALARRLQRQYDEQDRQQRLEQTENDQKLARRIAQSLNEADWSRTDDSGASTSRGDDRTEQRQAESQSDPGAASGYVACSKRVLECPYGDKCYRQSNKRHMAEFLHPSSCSSTRDSGNSKRARRVGNDGIVQRLENAQPVSLFVAKCRDIRSTWHEPLSISIYELLDPALGDLEASLQLTFMVDMQWLTAAYSVYDQQLKPMTLVHGCDGVESSAANVTVQRVQIPIAYGVHHSKLMVLQYSHGVRIVVHTANLIEQDWTNRSQGVWVSPLLPVVACDSTAADSSTSFRADLLSYLSYYRLTCLRGWITMLQRHDFSEVRAFFVGSVPGYHCGCDWGHRRLAYLLERHCYSHSLACSNCERDSDAHGQCSLLMQCSSIGSLGVSARSWFLSELAVSMSPRPPRACGEDDVYVVYPSEQDVIGSIEGCAGGACCLPYRLAVHRRQQWLRQYLCRWSNRALPHVKTYCRVSADRHHVHWLLLTSANLSKAAWGSRQTRCCRLLVRSYEAGVLLLPRRFSCATFSVRQTDAEASCSSVPVRLPYSLPVTRYTQHDEPWMCDVPHQQPGSATLPP